jgi:hypothetical protein
VNVLAPIVIECVSVDVDVNKSPFIPDVPEVPEVPPLPAVPFVPPLPAVPLVPDVPLIPDVPDVPFVPALIIPSKYVRLLSISAAVSGAPLGILVTNAIFYNY